MEYYVYTEKDASVQLMGFLQSYNAETLITGSIAYKVFGNVQPEMADYFVCPVYNHAQDGTSLLYEHLKREMPYYEGNESKHVFFDMHDQEEINSEIAGSIVFKPSATLENKALPMYYPVPTTWYSWLAFAPAKPIGECQFDVGFQGTRATHPIRDRIPDAMQGCREAGMKVYEQYQETFHFCLEPGERAYEMYTFYESILNSRFVLCPRGAGLSSYRIFEALASGRIPVIIADRIQLPLQNVFPWHEFSIAVPESDIENTHQYITQWCGTHSVSRCARLAAKVWRGYFDPPGLGLKRFLDASLVGRVNSLGTLSPSPCAVGSSA